MTRHGLVLAALAVAVMCVPRYGAAQDEQRVGADARSAVTLTVYQQDLGLVSERRRVRLTQGRNRLALEDVPAALRPETVSLRGAGLRVAEQAFAFDLVTPQRLLEAALGKTVRVVKTHPRTGEETVVEARLLGLAQGPVLQIGERIETTPPGRIALDRLPEGLRPRPTLLALLDSDRAGEADLDLSYLTGGLSWQADYVAEVDAAGDRLDLTGLVTLSNNSGTGFTDAALRLVAGDVSREPAAPALGQARMMAEAAMAAPAPQAVGDRYLYAFDRRVDLADRETKQVVLLEAGDVAVRREYRFEDLVDAQSGAEEFGPVGAAIVLKVENTADAGLGLPLPGGVVRVYEAAPGGRLFAGEDRIRHTPEGERIALTLGRAFDVTGEARRTVFERLSQRSYETAQEIVIRNVKDDPVEARVVGHMPQGWRLLSESAAHERETANRIAWTLAVPARGEATLTYRVRVSR